MLKAIVFDFDGTLTPNIRPAFQILEVSGLEGGASNPQFFKNVLERAGREEIDVYDAMARQICDIARAAGNMPTDKNLSMGANRRRYNPGVQKALEWLNQQGVECYLISSGLHSYLERTMIAPYFRKIFATTFHYNENGVATEPDEVMSVDRKAVALSEVAQSTNSDPQDYRGIVYIGDGTTDLVAMSHVTHRGGNAILVHLPEDDPELQDAQETGVIDMYDLIEQAKGIADLCALADFTESGEVMRYLRKLHET